MPTLEFFLLAESVSIDQATNRLSIFNVIEELTPVAAATASWPLVVSEMTAISAWNPDRDQAEPREHQLTTRIVIPGREIQNFTQQVVFVPHRRQRAVTRLVGIQITQPGVAEIEILLNGIHQAKHTITIREPVEPGAEGLVANVPVMSGA